MSSVFRIVPFLRPDSAALLGSAPPLDGTKEEPSLTLCSTDVFFHACGPLAGLVGSALRRSATFARMQSQASASGRSARWTSQLMWVGAGEVPAARYEWHVDRVGPGWNGTGGQEVADYSCNSDSADEDVAFGVVSYFWPDDESAPAAGLTTEFMLENLVVPVAGLVGDPRELGDSISRCVGQLDHPARIARHASDVLVWFSSRTLHRPPLADRPGWRFFLRVGWYEDPCSPYADHRLACHRVYDVRSARCLYRPAGTLQTLPAWSEPLSEPVSSCG